MFDKLKGWFGKDAKVNQKPTGAPPMPPVRKARESEKTTKQIATEKGEPYVAILSMDVDPTTCIKVHLNQTGMKSLLLDWSKQVT